MLALAPPYENVTVEIPYDPETPKATTGERTFRVPRPTPASTGANPADVWAWLQQYRGAVIAAAAVLALLMILKRR